MNRLSTEEVLNKAYRLAYFLHQDKALAIRIVAAATLKLNVAMAVQSKRLYYVPVGRFSRGESRRTDGIRNKALFSDLHLLQRLVYVESEPYERQKERTAQDTPPGVRAAGDPVSEEDLLVYFIKHLVRITTKRNAFYVTLGVCRLLHSYSTLETMELYNAVIGEPERVKDDYYYRSRKAVLMHEMYQRFGQLIRACRQRGREERFETQPGSSELRSLLKECLRVFTPWDTQCPVPPDFDPLKSVIASLASQHSDEENEVEIKRIHAILHPDCFERLVAAFGYRPPAERMEMPRFFLDQTDDECPPRHRSAPENLSADELTELSHMLDEQAGRRRRSSPTAVRIMVDGVERGRLNPAEQSSISFSVEEDAEIIQVKTTDPDGDLLLATHVLTSFGKDAHAAAVVYSIRLEGGQDLSLSITRRESEANGAAELLVKFGYRETNLRRVARLWWQRHRFHSSLEQGLWGGAGIYVLAGSLIVICLASYLYVRLRSRPASGPAQISVAQTASTPPRLDQTASQPVRRAKRERSNVAKVSPSPRPSTPAQARDEDVATDLTRGESAVPDLKLSEVKKVYIEIRGDASDELRRNLIERLNSSGVVTAVPNPDDADAALKIVVSQTTTFAQLVNARGTVLWPKHRYSGETNIAMSNLVKDLLSKIRQ